MDDDVFDRGLRAWAAPRGTLDSELLKVALHLDGLATSEESASAQMSLARDVDLADAFAILSARPRAIPIWRWLAPVALAAAIAAAYLARPTPQESALVPKGALDHLSIAVERGGERFELPGDRPLKEGDHFGLFYSASDAGHLAIVHYSMSGAEVLYTGPIAPAAGVALPKGGAVTQVSGCEALLAVFSKTPLELDDWEKRASFTDEDCRLSPQITGARTLQVIPIER